MRLFPRKIDLLDVRSAPVGLKIPIFLTILRIDFAATIQSGQICPDLLNAQAVCLNYAYSFFNAEPDMAIFLHEIRKFALRALRSSRQIDMFEYEVAYAEMLHCALNGLPLNSRLPVCGEVVSLLMRMGDSWRKILEGILLVDKIPKVVAGANLAHLADSYRELWNQLRGSDPESAIKFTSPPMTAYVCGRAGANNPGRPSSHDKFENSLSNYSFIFRLYEKMYDPIIALIATLRQYALNFCVLAGPGAKMSMCHMPYREGASDMAKGVFSASLLSGGPDDRLPSHD